MRQDPGGNTAALIGANGTPMVAIPYADGRKATGEVGIAPRRSHHVPDTV